MGNNLESIKQGGLSDKVWLRPEIQNYIKGDLVFGWVGSESRTAERDRIIESELRKWKYNSKAIANMLISPGGRYLGDRLSYADGDDEQIIRIHAMKILARAL